MTSPMPKLRIIAQPRAVYRERYICETLSRNRSQRFIRADENPDKYPYPTIEIPTEWTPKRLEHLYIRLTLVTVPNEQVKCRCIHPYPIDTEDNSVIKDTITNSLYFLVSDEELQAQRKSFLFSHKKLTLHQLKQYIPLKRLNSGINDDTFPIGTVDGRKFLETYQLNQSQLLFSIAGFQKDSQVPVIYDVSSVYSNVMTAATTLPKVCLGRVRCSPQYGSSQGGDEVLMVLPKIDKRKGFAVYFVHEVMSEQLNTDIEFVDKKTISFVTPPCPVTLTEDSATCLIRIIVIQSEKEIGQVNFLYRLYC